MHNTPYLIVIGKKKIWIIDVAIPGDSNRRQKIGEYHKVPRSEH